MSERPLLSIVVPAFNEEAVIGRFIESVHVDVTRLGISWEVIIVDDGSADETAAIARNAARADDRIRLVEIVHRGKGAAIRRGFQAARGRWVFMADADLSMPWDNLPRFLDPVSHQPSPQIVIGSREAPGARRTGEALRRRVSGRVFNALVRLIAVPGIQDSQCGYKLLSAEAVAALSPHLTIDGFAFDVEMLVLARLAGLDILEVGITCHCRHDSRVRFGPGAAAVVDLLRVNLNARRGRYAALVPAAPPEPVRHSG